VPAHDLANRPEMVRTPRAPQRRRDALIEYPAHGEIEHAARIALMRELIELLDGFQILPKAWRLEFRIVQAEVIALELGVGPHAERPKP